MNRDDILSMARVAKLSNEIGAFGYPYLPELERFAALVAAHEREECAKVLDKVIEHLYIYNYDGDASTELRRCAKTIREKN